MSKIIDKLHNDYLSYLSRISQLHDEHILRIERAVEWFNHHRVLESPAKETGYLRFITNGNDVKVEAEFEKGRLVESDFVNHKLKVDGVECVCVYADLTGVPVFNATFRIRPLQADKDLGTGCGNMKQYDF